MKMEIDAVESDRVYNAVARVTSPIARDALLSCASPAQRNAVAGIIDRVMAIAEVRTFPLIWALRRPMMMGCYNHYQTHRVIFLRRRILTGRLSPADVLDTIIHEALHMAGERDMLARTVTTPFDHDIPLSYAEHVVVHAAALELAAHLDLPTVAANRWHRDHYLKLLARVLKPASAAALTGELYSLSVAAARQLVGQDVPPGPSLQTVLARHAVG